MDVVVIDVAAVAVVIVAGVAVVVIVVDAEISRWRSRPRHLRDKELTKSLIHHVDAKTSEVAQATAWPDERPGQGWNVRLKQASLACNRWSQLGLLRARSKRCAV